MCPEGEEFHHPEEALCYASNGKVEGTHHHRGVLGTSKHVELVMIPLAKVEERLSRVEHLYIDINDAKNKGLKRKHK